MILLTITYKRKINNVEQEFTHNAPPCSNFKIKYADVDKEGSGRNELTGEMFRERIGYYVSIEMKWDLIPNSAEYIEWYEILTHLPPFFNCNFLMPNGKKITKKMYRTDIDTDLYLFVAPDPETYSKGQQIWQGLATTFVQADVTPYDDNVEPQ